MDPTVSRLQAETDFACKYANANWLARRLIDGYFRSVKALIDRIPEGELQSALEIGCGEGYSTQRLRAFFGPAVRFEASEYLERQIAVAQKNAPGIRISQEDVHRLQRPDDSVSLLLLLEVLEHLDNVPNALRELRRVTQRYVIIGVPREPLWRMLNLLRGKYLGQFGNTPSHINHWSTTALKKLIAGAGFRIVDVRQPLPWSLVLARKLA